MQEALFELVERLTQTAITHLIDEDADTRQGQRKLNIHVEIKDLRDLLDKARHEQKGGP